ncbi:MAG: ATP-dependent DNA helicase RecG [Patescibacteria group bacterium]|nr:ATP-dependent DNA helicase RecG [Patescibacteria group bacterium]
MFKLTDPIENLKGIGDKIGAKFHHLGISCLKDLLFVFPKSYLNLNSIKEINKIKLNEKQIIRGKISHLRLVRTRFRRFTILEGIINDQSGSIKFVFFNQPYLEPIINDKKVYFWGKSRLKNGQMILENPGFELADKPNENQFLPIYPSVAGQSSKKIRYFINQILPLARKIKNPFNVEIEQKYDLCDFQKTIRNLHQPKNITSLSKAKKTWAILELLSFIGQSKLMKDKQKTYQSFCLKSFPLKSYINNLPFTLTIDQKTTLKTLLNEFQNQSSVPGSEYGFAKSVLLNGDVGSGKTIVAFLIAINTILNKKQVALMAPTEILAKQHFDTFQKFFSDSKFKACLITNSHKIKIINKKQINFKVGELKNVINKNQFIFGTHALLQEKVKFKNLGLAVIDEQQRFGVKQRALLRRKSNNPNFLPHLLLLTATPIPRTLALMVMQDLKVLFLHSTPFKRQVKTQIYLERSRQKVNTEIFKKLKMGEQVFVVCPIIKENENLDFDNRKAAEIEFKKITTTFKDYKVGLMHGRLKPKEKEKAIADFRKGKTQILVSTSVVEVGVDIPQATILLVETAERFGLSQLHQLRGRIGRAGDKALAFFMTNSKEATQKLKILKETDDGFQVAMADLKQRGPGQILGQSQHGLLNFRFANIFDNRIIKTVKEIIKTNPQLSSQIYKNIFK